VVRWHAVWPSHGVRYASEFHGTVSGDGGRKFRRSRGVVCHDEPDRRHPTRSRRPAVAVPGPQGRELEARGAEGNPRDPVNPV